uniref:DUF4200 domain-containing protein n=1 Tax=Caenorhabditis tropicalis TaxID=1561998 RepID=A0A1I7TFG6_9PELO
MSRENSEEQVQTTGDDRNGSMLRESENCMDSTDQTKSKEIQSSRITDNEPDKSEEVSRPSEQFFPETQKVSNQDTFVMIDSPHQNPQEFLGTEQIKTPHQPDSLCPIPLSQPSRCHDISSSANKEQSLIPPLKEPPIMLKKEEEEDEIKMQSEPDDYESLMRKMMEEEERAEQEFLEQRLKRQQERKDQKLKVLEKEAKDKKEREQLEERKRKEIVERVNQKKKSVIMKLANENKIMEEMREKSLESLRQKADEEMKEIQNERQREKEKHEMEIEQLEQDFQEEKIKIEEESKLRDEERKRLEEEHKEKVRKMIEEMEREIEEIRRRSREKRSRMEDQWEEIKKVLQYKIWNEIIERNWTNRLNVLRGANRKVAELFYRFYSEASDIQRKIDKSEDVSNKKNIIFPLLKTLIASIESEKEMMIQEAGNLQIQYENTGKHFVLIIKESVEKVESGCIELENSLRNYSTMLESESPISSSDHSFILNLMKSDFDSLSKCSISIPTLAELKNIYNQEMKQENSSNTNQEVVQFQSVIIEEIE